MCKKIASSLKQEEIETLTEQLTQLQGQFQQLNQDANTLAERYSRLEKYDRFKNRFQEILAERNELRVTKENFSHSIVKLNKSYTTCSKIVTVCYKNELAKAKVEAIIQRLAILGTAQDQHAQEIQQLAHPNAEAGEETQS